MLQHSTDQEQPAPHTIPPRFHLGPTHGPFSKGQTWGHRAWPIWIDWGGSNANHCDPQLLLLREA